MSSLQQQPLVFFVPGAWHYPACFDGVRARLEKLGYPTETIAHASIGEEPPVKNHVEDIANLRVALKTLVDAGKDVVVVAHSYGGIVASTAVEGLGFPERRRDGKKGGIIQLVYLCAFALPKGTSLLSALGDQPLPWWGINGNYTHTISPEVVFYHDVPAAEQQHWIAQLTHSHTDVFSGSSSFEPWHVMSCAYIFCDQDKAIPLFMQEQMAAGMGEGVTTVHLDASHSPQLSQPEKLVEAVVHVTRVALEKKGVEA